MAATDVKAELQFQSRRQDVFALFFLLSFLPHFGFTVLQPMQDLDVCVVCGHTRACTNRDLHINVQFRL